MLCDIRQDYETTEQLCLQVQASASAAVYLFQARQLGDGCGNRHLRQWISLLPLRITALPVANTQMTHLAQDDALTQLDQIPSSPNPQRN
jgi:hypothetical protein